MGNNMPGGESGGLLILSKLDMALPLISADSPPISKGMIMAVIIFLLFEFKISPPLKVYAR